jgi:hypothetical protein
MILDMYSSHRSFDPVGSLTYPLTLEHVDMYFERLYVKIQ